MKITIFVLAAIFLSSDTDQPMKRMRLSSADFFVRHDLTDGNKLSPRPCNSFLSECGTSIINPDGFALNTLIANSLCLKLLPNQAITLTIDDPKKPLYVHVPLNLQGRMKIIAHEDIDSFESNFDGRIIKSSSGGEVDCGNSFFLHPVKIFEGESIYSENRNIAITKLELVNEFDGNVSFFWT